MAARKPYLLRVDPAVLDALQKWAGDELRSLNAQIEFVLRRALLEEGRLRRAPAPPAVPPDPGAGGRPESDVE